MFDSDVNAQWAFQSAIASTMPGVFPDEITVNLVSTLAVENGTLTVIHRRLSGLQSTAIGINYNVTLESIERFGFNDPAACFAFVSNELITGIDNGNFSSALQSISAALNVTMFPSATSSKADYVFIRDFVIVGTPKATYPPSSFPSSKPTGPTSSPSVGATTTSPTRFVPPMYMYDVTVGITLAACAFGFAYFIAVATGFFRTDHFFVDHIVSKLKSKHNTAKEAAELIGLTGDAQSTFHNWFKSETTVAESGFLHDGGEGVESRLGVDEEDEAKSSDGDGDQNEGHEGLSFSDNSSGDEDNSESYDENEVESDAGSNDGSVVSGYDV